MKGSTGRIGRAFAALAFAGALGFGTVQAFASGAPRAPQRACDQSYCRISCIASGASGGSCKLDYSTGEYYCQCIVIE